MICARKALKTGVLATVVVLLIAGLSLTGVATTHVTLAVTNTSCAQLTITQVLFLVLIVPVHLQIALYTVPLGETTVLEYDFEQTPTVLQLGGMRDGSAYQATVAVPGSTSFPCGTITVTVGTAPSPTPSPGMDTAQLTRWAVPTANARPSGIGVSADGKVYFTEYAGNKIGQLDPTANQMRERNTTGGPFGLYVSTGGSLYYSLATANALEVMAFTGGTSQWSLPTPNSLPGVPVYAPLGPGQINLWVPERNTGKLARFAPAIVPIPMILITTSPTTVAPTTSEIVGVTSTVSPELHPGNPMLPPPVALLTPTPAAPFAEWDGPGDAVRAAVTADGRVWFADGATSIAVLDPATNVASYYGLPPGTQALGLTVGPNGWVWFTDLGRPAIGVLEPASADVRLWAIAGGGQPFDLVRDSVGNLWFTDRTANTIGRLNPFSNELTIYPLTGNPQPLFLSLDGEEQLWFTADQGNFIGRLSIAPVLGPPPSPTGTFGFTDVHVSLSGPIFGQWKSAQITVSYTYDGSAGLPVWLRVEMLSGGSVVAGFAATPAQVTSSGTGSAVVQVSYNGGSSASTDQIRVIASTAQWGTAFAQMLMTAGPIGWAP
ncbi:MAG: hypothetical protein AB1778_06755 [Candidatus Bipolaricaulota bacterium]